MYDFLRQMTEEVAHQISKWNALEKDAAINNWLAAEKIVFSCWSVARQFYESRTAGPQVEDLIRQIAYQMWEAAGQQQGIALDTWLSAQKLVILDLFSFARQNQPPPGEEWLGWAFEPELVADSGYRVPAAHPCHMPIESILEILTNQPQVGITCQGGPFKDDMPKESILEILAKGPGPSRPPPRQASIALTVSGEAPKELRVNEIGLVDFRIERKEQARPLAGARVDIDVTPAEEIRVFLSTHGCAVEFLGSRVLTAMPPAPGEAVQNAFEIRPRAAGKLDLAIHVRQGGSELARLTFAVEVVERQASDKRIGARTAAAPRNLADDDILDLLVEEVPDKGGIRYRYTLTAFKLGLVHRHFDTPDSLKNHDGVAIGSTRMYVDWIYKELTQELAQQLTKSDSEELVFKISDIGNDMGLELFEPDFVRILWPLRDRIRTILVCSWEPLIPWELVRFRHPDTNERDEKYLCEYGLVRMLEKQELVRDLCLSDWSYLKAEYPKDDNRAIGEDEVEYFTEALRGRGIQAMRIDPREKALRSALREGAFDVLHFACHGRSEHNQIESSELILGETPGAPGVPSETVSISPMLVRNEACLKDRHPIVFLNACESGRMGPNLTAWGGWPSVFLERGAGVFVGTSWPVRARPSKIFAETFYDSLFAQQSLAEAATTARIATKDLGDASWLAYKVFGYPLARLTSASA